MKQMIKKIKLHYTIKVLTGLHIGGNKDNVEIGGIDLPVIKLAARDNEPYIPGSSLKGKMRCLLEQTRGVTNVGGDSDVNKLFGITKKDNDPVRTENIPSRLIVRDAYLTEESKKQIAKCESMEMPYTEGKWENVIDRMKGVAEHPRQIERVPAGAEFAAEFILNVWESDDKNDAMSETEMIALLEKGIALLENDYLGGSGSRGYGQVKLIKSGRVEYNEDNNWNV